MLSGKLQLVKLDEKIKFQCCGCRKYKRKGFYFYFAGCAHDICAACARVIARRFLRTVLGAKISEMDFEGIK